MRTGPPTVVLATTNGKGMGHLSRQLALALASLGGMDPVIFSLSSAVTVVNQYGMRAEWAPGSQRKQVPRRHWDAYLAERITAVVAETNASAFVFDGVYPYDGVLRALRRMPDVPFIWSRRAMWKKGVGARALRYRRLFAAVLEPGDLASAGDVGRTVYLEDSRRVGPITLVGQVPQLDREQAGAELGLDPDKPRLLLTLGSSKRSDLYAAYQRTVEQFSAAGWQVVVTSSPLRGRAAAANGLKQISVFPLVRYMKAFDAAVSASGYNAVHELLYSAVPTLLVPNADAVTDDQRTRARIVANTGLALSADPDRPREFDAALERLLDQRVRDRLAASCRDLEPPTGATEAARTVIGLAAVGVPAGERMEAASLHAQRFARRTIGRVLPPAVANLVGRPPRLTRPGDLRGPLSVSPVLAPGLQGVPQIGRDQLLVTDALTPGLFDGRFVEHLLPGASDDYVRARAEIAARYYRLGSLASAETELGEAIRAKSDGRDWTGLGWSGR
ncbi:glycosyltransferase [Kineosporia babensis]|uniref:Glycosyl transferase family 28 C-terminal domain-containing protein n=1 Tax=Kineosporia babensis TaxID=499548 RepID=A0A9X1NI47_9ACTN|nr:glycosyltransferase [Kineosporia babensis]MCD5315467.1 hypothetical protein [Kineosporia babensis]